MLKFDQPVMVPSKNAADEGKIQPGRGKQIASMLMTGGVGIGAKDLADGLSGAVFKSWYMIPHFVRYVGVLLQWRRRESQTRRQAGNRVPEELNGLHHVILCSPARVAS